MDINIPQGTILKAAQGDQQAFETLYRCFSKYVYNIAWRVVSTREDAEEVTQEVFLIVYRKLKNFRFESSLKTWIYRLTINQALNYLKKTKQGKYQMTEYKDEFHVSQEKEVISRKADKEYHENVIAKLLEALNPEQRACIVLRNIENQSYQEIATTLNLNINTVRSRLKRAREKLLSLKREVIKNEL